MNKSNQKAAFVYGTDNDIYVQFIDSDAIIRYRQALEKKFINDIPTLFKNIDGIFLKVFKYPPIGFESNMEWCKAVKEKLDSHQIKHYFCNEENTVFSELLIASNVSPVFNDAVCFVMVFFDNVTIHEFVYTEIGYKKLNRKQLSIDVKENPNLIREKILGSSNPKKIILVRNAENCPLLKFLRTILKSNKLIVFDQGQDFSSYHITELSKWMFDKSFIKYHILPTCARPYFFCDDYGDQLLMLIDLKTHQDILPFEKTFYFTKKTNTKISYGYYEFINGTKKFKKSIKMEEKCHRNVITFSVDAENFLEIDYKVVIFPIIQELPQNLDQNFGKNIPVIGITGDLSVICVSGKNGYKFLDSWNGLYGKDLFISFEKEKPKFFDDTFQLSSNKDKQPYVVYNLLVIMALTPDDAKSFIDEERPDAPSFAITKDEKNPVLLEFAYGDGTKKVATPAFLMAMIIKEQLKAIKTEIGEKPAEIGFVLLDDEWNEDQRKRIEDGLKESCNLLSEYRKIDCVFVNI